MRSLPAITFSIVIAIAGQAGEPRPFDGTGNNEENPSFGASFTELLRLTPNYYGDGVSEPSGAGRPSARAISNIVSDQEGEIFTKLGVSDMVWQWGQFIDHDITLVEGTEETFNIQVPQGDVFFDPFGTGQEVIPLRRSIFSESSGVRQQVNVITAWLDGSMVYGSDAETAASLRTFDGSGKLATSPGNLLPIGPTGQFIAGDVRAAEQSGLTAMHTLFMREHNALCDAIVAEFPEMTGEQIYNRARTIVIAEIQHITYYEWLPVVLGKPFPKYKSYTDVNPGITNEFATAAFRFGHTMLGNNLLRLDANLSVIPEGNLPLAEAFFDPTPILESGIAPILRGLAIQPAQELDTKLVDAVRNFLFGPPGSGGFDLASLNIQRGRDHGLGSLNEVREALGLHRHNSYDALAFGKDVSNALERAYGKGNVDQVDLWVGGLAERKVKGSLVGGTFYFILTEQFQSLRDGDRYYFEKYLSDADLVWVSGQSLASIIRRNTDIGNEIPDNVFLAN